MKTLLILFAALILFFVLPDFSEAQIPNAGFENWTSGNPDGWFTSNLPDVAFPVTKSSTSHSGSSALRGEIISYMFFTLTPTLMAGSDAKGFPVNQRYIALNGYYQFNPIGGDAIFITIAMKREGVGIGGGSLILPVSASSYTQFTVGIIYSSYQMPDSCTITIVVGNSVITGGLHVGTTMLLDDLSFSGGATSVPEDEFIKMHESKLFTLAQSYPNPFNSECEIKYEIQEPSELSITVHDVGGKEVAKLFQGENVPGFHEVLFQPDRLPSGLYFYRMTAKSMTTNKIYSEVGKALYVK